MKYSSGEVMDILGIVLTKIRSEFEHAVENDEVDEFLDRHSIFIERTESSMFVRGMKILVLGDLPSDVSKYQLVASKLGIPKDDLVFIGDYEKMTNFNTATLRYSTKYSDVILGHVPHSQKNIGDNSSLKAAMINDPESYPRLIVGDSTDNLKITTSRFDNLLRKTKYFEELCNK